MQTRWLRNFYISLWRRDKVHGDLYASRSSSFDLRDCHDIRVPPHTTIIELWWLLFEYRFLNILLLSALLCLCNHLLLDLSFTKCRLFLIFWNRTLKWAKGHEHIFFIQGTHLDLSWLNLWFFELLYVFTLKAWLALLILSFLKHHLTLVFPFSVIQDSSRAQLPRCKRSDYRRFTLHIVIDIVIQVVPEFIVLNSSFPHLIIFGPLLDLEVIPHSWHFSGIATFSAVSRITTTVARFTLSVAGHDAEVRYSWLHCWNLGAKIVNDIAIVCSRNLWAHESLIIGWAGLVATLWIRWVRTRLNRHSRTTLSDQIVLRISIHRLLWVDRSGICAILKSLLHDYFFILTLVATTTTIIAVLGQCVLLFLWQWWWLHRLWLLRNRAFLVSRFVASDHASIVTDLFDNIRAAQVICVMINAGIGLRDGILSIW